MAGEAFGVRSDGLVVDVWSDVMCPFCYLGDAFLQQALQQFPHRDSVTVRYRNFLLMPELATDTAMNLNELLATKRGFPRDQAAAMNAQFAERGKPAGLDYQMDKAIATNTRSAHRLSHLAASQGRQHDMIQRLFKAYFTDGLNIGDFHVLADLAAEIGLDHAEALAVLESPAFETEVDSDLNQARGLGISGVPFFVFQGKYAVSGAQPVGSYLEVLDRTWAELTESATPATR